MITGLAVSEWEKVDSESLLVTVFSTLHGASERLQSQKNTVTLIIQLRYI